MQFGYFTLSDNGYRNNTRTSNSLVAEIIDQAILRGTDRPTLRLDRRASLWWARCIVLSRPCSGIHSSAHAAH